MAFFGRIKRSPFLKGFGILTREIPPLPDRCSFQCGSGGMASSFFFSPSYVFLVIPPLSSSCFSPNEDSLLSKKTPPPFPEFVEFFFFFFVLCFFSTLPAHGRVQIVSFFRQGVMSPSDAERYAFPPDEMAVGLRPPSDSRLPFFSNRQNFFFPICRHHILFFFSNLAPPSQECAVFPTSSSFRCSPPPSGKEPRERNSISLFE